MLFDFFKKQSFYPILTKISKDFDNIFDFSNTSIKKSEFSRNQNTLLRYGYRPLLFTNVN